MGTDRETWTHQDGLGSGGLAVRIADGAALAVRELLAGQGPFCRNPLGGSLRDEVGGRRRLVLLEEVH